MNRPRRCFVISPIGAEGSETREYANDVFRFIIKPAMQQCGIEVVRSDHLREPGRISEQMYRELFTADLCVAVFAERNPNVLYELALAQTAGRPVVLLVPKGEILPFDVQDLRCVMYDHRPTPLVDGVYAAEVVEHIRSLETSAWHTENPFLSQGFPASEDSGVSYLEHAGKSVPPDAWAAMATRTTSVFELMGLSLHSWKRTDDVAAVLADKAASGCSVRVMLVDPASDALVSLFSGELADRTLASVRDDIERSREFFSRICAREPGMQLRMVRRGVPLFQSTRTDEEVLFVAYLYSQPTAYSPTWRGRCGTSLYDAVAAEFQALWSANG